jgi:hypothetical protein
LSHLRRSGILDFDRAVYPSLAIAVPKEKRLDAEKFARNFSFGELIFHSRQKKSSTFQEHLWYIFSTGQAQFLHFFGVPPNSADKILYFTKTFQTSSCIPGLESALLRKR